MEIGRSVLIILTGKRTGKRRSERRWEDNIRINLKEISVNTRNWIYSAQNK